MYIPVKNIQASSKRDTLFQRSDPPEKTLIK
jgi:hypothetical protein